MKLNLESVNQLASLLDVCRAAGIESAVVNEGKFRGIDTAKTVCILTNAGFEIDEGTSLGIGRIGELAKRLSLFTGNISIDTTVNQRNEISSLNISSAKSKATYRCTSEKLMRYPKANDDDSVATIELSRDEVTSIGRAISAMGAPHVIVHCSRNGNVKIECMEESTNDSYSIDIEAPATFEDEGTSFVLNFSSKIFRDLTSLEVKNNEKVVIEFGSISATLKINGHTLVMLSVLTGEEDDE